MFGLAGTRSGLSLGKLEYHQSVVEQYPNFVELFSYLKDFSDVDPFNISGLGGVKESEKVKL